MIIENRQESIRVKKNQESIKLQVRELENSKGMR